MPLLGNLELASLDRAGGGVLGEDVAASQGNLHAAIVVLKGVVEHVGVEGRHHCRFGIIAFAVDLDSWSKRKVGGLRVRTMKWEREQYLLVPRTSETHRAYR